MQKRKGTLSEGARAILEACLFAKEAYDCGEESSPLISLDEMARYMAYNKAKAEGKDPRACEYAGKVAAAKLAKHGDPYRCFRRYAEEINSLRGYGHPIVIVVDNKIGIPDKETAQSYQKELRARALRLLERSADIGYALRKENPGQNYLAEAYPPNWYLAVSDEMEAAKEGLEELIPCDVDDFCEELEEIE